MMPAMYIVRPLPEGLLICSVTLTDPPRMPRLEEFVALVMNALSFAAAFVSGGATMPG
ncbi:hypothetical protein D3C84_1251580 [compost metagenome]